MVLLIVHPALLVQHEDSGPKLHTAMFAAPRAAYGHFFVALRAVSLWISLAAVGLDATHCSLNHAGVGTANRQGHAIQSGSPRKVFSANTSGDQAYEDRCQHTL